ncbi:hypothetical protein KC19_1G308400 [Ceratodon purpureus]|uniref:F-box domain-containing protein n=1 Tax=Ceratodon purpureus TaxID=3225 RepID=A0A8T0JCH5_CERPU|nr:hypothetical protein KC19_1G308400 [Ceratodon purpureus]KAG0593165.1 hypothetical protein KC19_1G308400 [Ceratodon purpureus]
MHLSQPECKVGREFDGGCWRHSEMRMMGQETGRAPKLVRCGDVSTREVGAEPEVRSNVPESSSKICEDIHAIRDPFDALGVDILHSHIFTLLDSRSLARCAAVSSRWQSLATADKLWQPLVAAFLAQRAHLPLCLMGRDISKCKGQKLLYTIAVMDSRQRDIVPAEMCGRTWELRLKPTCGPYWLGYDPTQIGKPGLKRYFHCDGSITSGPNDPIWGGHSSVWEYIHLKGGYGKVGKYVQINRWPPLTPRRVKDGRWVLENFYGLYITRPDNPTFSTKRYSETECKRLCSYCTPPTYGVKI